MRWQKLAKALSAVGAALLVAANIFVALTHVSLPPASQAIDQIAEGRGNAPNGKKEASATAPMAVLSGPSPRPSLLNGRESLTPPLQSKPRPLHWDAAGEYWILARVLAPAAPAAVADLPTLVTHCTPGHLHHVARTAMLWPAPISVAVFAADEVQLEVAMRSMQRLLRCHQEAALHVTLTLVAPRSVPYRKAVLQAGLDSIVRPQGSEAICLGPSLARAQPESVNYAQSLVPYPNNLLRNVARTQAQTVIVMVLDVDVYPFPRTLPADLLQITREQKSNGRRAAYVLPVFEHNGDLATLGDLGSLTQAGLGQAMRGGRVQPFYFDLCPHCHAPTQYARWWAGTDTTPFRVDYYDPWEPFYASQANITPPYDERFKQYGFNRISQVCETFVAGFDFLVVPGAFLLHEGFKRKDAFHNSKQREQEQNRLLFRSLKTELRLRYPASLRRCRRPSPG